MAAPRWLILIHSIPPKPDYFRVKVRRRLARLGAGVLKNTVYVLPNNDEAMEDFVWLAQEIRDDGGEALVAAADFVAGTTDEELQQMFDAMTTGKHWPAPAGDVDAVPPGRTWVTRVGVKVDRIASAWLIRTFIDPEARFKFVAERGYRPADGELRFDMYEGEYTHEGGGCTFETLVRRFGLGSDRGLVAVGEVVHDIDCKDERFGRPETAGVATLVQSVVTSSADDAARLERGATIFADLYRALKA